MEELVWKIVEMALEIVDMPKVPTFVAEGGVFLSRDSETINSVQYCLLEIDALKEALDDECCLSG
jgi:hypothetical protein